MIERVTRDGHGERGRLTLIVVELVASIAVEHPEQLQNVAVAVVAVKLISRAIEAEDQLAGFMLCRAARPRRLRHGGGGGVNTPVVKGEMGC